MKKSDLQALLSTHTLLLSTIREPLQLLNAYLAELRDDPEVNLYDFFCFAEKTTNLPALNKLFSKGFFPALKEGLKPFFKTIQDLRVLPQMLLLLNGTSRPSFIQNCCDEVERYFDSPILQQQIALGFIDPNLFLFAAAVDAEAQDRFEFLLNHPACSAYGLSFSKETLELAIEASDLDPALKALRIEQVKQKQKREDAVPTNYWGVSLQEVEGANVEFSAVLEEPVSLINWGGGAAEGIEAEKIKRFYQLITWLQKNPPFSSEANIAEYKAGLAHLRSNTAFRTKDKFPEVLESLEQFAATIQGCLQAKTAGVAFSESELIASLLTGIDQLNKCAQGVISYLTSVMIALNPKLKLLNVITAVIDESAPQLFRVLGTPAGMQVHFGKDQLMRAMGVRVPAKYDPHAMLTSKVSLQALANKAMGALVVSDALFTGSVPVLDTPARLAELAREGVINFAKLTEALESDWLSVHQARIVLNPEQRWKEVLKFITDLKEEEIERLIIDASKGKMLAIGQFKLKDKTDSVPVLDTPSRLSKLAPTDTINFKDFTKGLERDWFSLYQDGVIVVSPGQKWKEILKFITDLKEEDIDSLITVASERMLAIDEFKLKDKTVIEKELAEKYREQLREKKISIYNPATITENILKQIWRILIKPPSAYEFADIALWNKIFDHPNGLYLLKAAVELHKDQSNLITEQHLTYTPPGSSQNLLKALTSDAFLTEWLLGQELVISTDSAFNKYVTFRASATPSPFAHLFGRLFPQGEEGSAERKITEKRLDELLVQPGSLTFVLYILSSNDEHLSTYGQIVSYMHAGQAEKYDNVLQVLYDMSHKGNEIQKATAQSFLEARCKAQRELKLWDCYWTTACYVKDFTLEFTEKEQVESLSNPTNARAALYVAKNKADLEEKIRACADLDAAKREEIIRLINSVYSSAGRAEGAAGAGAAGAGAGSSVPVDKMALYFAAYRGEIGRVNALLASGGIEVNAEIGADRFTPLQAAAVKGHIEVVRALIDKGAKIPSFKKLLRTRASKIASVLAELSKESKYHECILAHHSAADLFELAASDSKIQEVLADLAGNPANDAAFATQKNVESLVGFAVYRAIADTLLARLVANPVHAPVFATKAGMQFLVKSLDSSDLSLKANAVRVLAELAQMNGGAHLIVAAGAIPKLMSLVGSLEHTMEYDALFTLAFARTIQGLDAIISHATAITKLISLLDSTDPKIQAHALIALAVTNIESGRTAILNHPTAVSNLIILLDSKIQGEALNALVILAKTGEAGCRALVSSHAIPKLVDLLKSKDQIIQKDVATVFMHLAAHREFHDAIISNPSSIPRLISLLESEVVHPQAALALVRLANDNAFKTTNGMRNLLHLFNQEAYKSIAEPILMRLIANPENDTHFATQEGIEVLTNLLDSEDIAVKKNALRALANCIAKEEGRKCIEANPRAIIIKLFNLIASEDIEIKNHAALALTHLMSSKAVCDAVRSIPEPIPKLISKLDLSDRNSVINEHILRSLIHLCRNSPEHLDRLNSDDIREDFIAKLIDLTHADIVGVFGNAGVFLSFFVKKGGLDFIAASFHEGRLPKLVNWLGLAEESIQRNATVILAALSTKAECCDTLLSAGEVIPRLVHLLNSENKEIQFEVTAILANLCEKNVDALLSVEGIIPKLVSMVHSGISGIQDNVMRVVGKIAEREAYHAAVCSAILPVEGASVIEILRNTRGVGVARACDNLSKILDSLVKNPANAPAFATPEGVAVLFSIVHFKPVKSHMPRAFEMLLTLADNPANTSLFATKAGLNGLKGWSGAYKVHAERILIAVSSDPRHDKFFFRLESGSPLFDLFRLMNGSLVVTNNVIRILSTITADDARTVDYTNVCKSSLFPPLFKLLDSENLDIKKTMSSILLKLIKKVPNFYLGDSYAETGLHKIYNLLISSDPILKQNAIDILSIFVDRMSEDTEFATETGVWVLSCMLDSDKYKKAIKGLHDLADQDRANLIASASGIVTELFRLFDPAIPADSHTNTLQIHIDIIELLEKIAAKQRNYSEFISAEGISKLVMAVNSSSTRIRYSAIGILINLVQNRENRALILSQPRAIQNLSILILREEMALECMKILATLSFDREGLSAIVSAVGLIPKIVSFLDRADQIYHDYNTDATCILAYAAATEAGRRAIVAADGTSKVIKMLASENPQLRNNSAIVLVALARVPEHDNAFATPEGVRGLVCLLTYKDCTKVVARDALARLAANPANDNIFAAPEGVGGLIDLLGLTETKAIAKDALARLAANPANDNIFATPEGVDGLIDLLGSTKTVGIAADALARLAAKPEHNDVFASQKRFSALSKLLEYEETSARAIDAVMRFAAIPENHRSIVAQGVVPKLEELLGRAAVAEEIKAAATSLLDQLSSGRGVLREAAANRPAGAGAGR